MVAGGARQRYARSAAKLPVTGEHAVIHRPGGDRRAGHYPAGGEGARARVRRAGDRLADPRPGRLHPFAGRVPARPGVRHRRRCGDAAAGRDDAAAAARGLGPGKERRRTRASRRPGRLLRRAARRRSCRSCPRDRDDQLPRIGLRGTTIHPGPARHRQATVLPPGRRARPTSRPSNGHFPGYSRCCWRCCWATAGSTWPTAARIRSRRGADRRPDRAPDRDLV